MKLSTTISPPAIETGLSPAEFKAELLAEYPAMTNIHGLNRHVFIMPSNADDADVNAEGTAIWTDRNNFKRLIDKATADMPAGRCKVVCTFWSSVNSTTISGIVNLIVNGDIVGDGTFTKVMEYKDASTSGVGNKTGTGTGQRIFSTISHEVILSDPGPINVQFDFRPNGSTIMSVWGLMIEVFCVNAPIS